MGRREILDRLATFSEGLDHDTRLGAISLLLAAWAWQDERFPDEVRAFREEVLCQLAHPGRPGQTS